MNKPLLAQKSPRLEINTYLAAWVDGDCQRQSVSTIIQAVLHGASVLAHRLSTGAIHGDPARLVGSNADGDLQKEIDVASHELFIGLLEQAGAAQVLSEERDNPVVFKDIGLAVAIDPIDGSGNVGLGTPVGTIFSIVPFEKGQYPFGFPGSKQIAAGYLLYGSSIELGFSVGKGVVLATLDPDTKKFLIVRENVTIPSETSELAFNACTQRHLYAPLANYVKDCLAGATGARGRDFNMRWIGSAVADIHRILLKGGMFFYGSDRRQGYEYGRLRLQYEANPIAFLVEQAGGKATNGVIRILDIVPTKNHCRTPLAFGSAAEVNEIARYFELNAKA